MQRSARGFTFFVYLATLGKVMLPRNEECHKSLCTNGWERVPDISQTLAPFETCE
jgi:hypothetical protein